MNKAFTLAELLIALAIIAILTAIAIPIYGRYKLTTYNQVAVYDLKNLMSGELAYFSQKLKFASFNASNIQPNGVVVAGDFYFKALSKGVTAIAKTDSSGTYLNLCVKHYLGNHIYCYESDRDSIFYTDSPVGHQLTEDDCPDATADFDCKPPQWKVFK